MEPFILIAAAVTVGIVAAPSLSRAAGHWRESLEKTDYCVLPPTHQNREGRKKALAEENATSAKCAT